MKASVYYKYGNSEVLEIKEIEKPRPKADEILVKVKASTVNRTDCAMLKAKPYIMRLFTGFFAPRNPILGTDFAGIIEEVGVEIKGLKIGDRVFGFSDLGVSSHAEYLCISKKKAWAKIPDNITFEQAAASLEGAHYAINFINKVKINPNQKVLVYGASGAIGSAMVQILKSATNGLRKSPRL
jgi:NADPH:quinone reductase-like Zn-dependent oxidoreductase